MFIPKRDSRLFRAKSEPQRRTAARRGNASLCVINFLCLLSALLIAGDAAAQDHRARPRRAADDIDLVGLPARELPAEVQSIPLPKRGISSIINPQVNAPSVLDPARTGAIGTPAPATGPQRKPARVIDMSAPPPPAARSAPAGTEASIVEEMPFPEMVRPMPPTPRGGAAKEGKPRAAASETPALPVTTAAAPLPSERAPQIETAPLPPPVIAAALVEQQAGPVVSVPAKEPEPKKVAAPAPPARPATRPVQEPMDPQFTATITPRPRRADPQPQARATPAEQVAAYRDPSGAVEDFVLDEEMPERVYEPAKRNRMSREWEVPRAPRRSGRPALDRQSETQITLPTTRINYIVRAQALEKILQEIGQLAGTRVVANPAIRTVVRDRRLEGPAHQVLDRLSREFGLFWFTDGSTIFVDPASDMKSRLFKVRNASAAAIESSLSSSGLDRYRDRIRPVGNDGLVRVTGPESLQKLVETVLSGVETDRSAVHLVKFGQKSN